LFLGLRDVAQLEGKCGACEFRRLCGGSRSRAYALTGNYHASDPRCAYRPSGLLRHEDGNMDTPSMPEISA
jgi:MoaA/NifB/PqqE/SkfB family radical SAM enzyme